MLLEHEHALQSQAQAQAAGAAARASAASSVSRSTGAAARASAASSVSRSSESKFFFDLSKSSTSFGVLDADAAGGSGTGGATAGDAAGYGDEDTGLEQLRGQLSDAENKSIRVKASKK